MKSFDQLAQSAYTAYCKQMEKEAQHDFAPELPAWTWLPESERNAWIACAQQLLAEFAALH
jgi:hypothetical protein